MLEEVGLESKFRRPDLFVVLPGLRRDDEVQAIIELSSHDVRGQPGRVSNVAAACRAPLVGAVEFTLIGSKLNSLIGFRTPPIRFVPNPGARSRLTVAVADSTSLCRGQRPLLFLGAGAVLTRTPGTVSKAEQRRQAGCDRLIAERRGPAWIMHDGSERIFRKDTWAWLPWGMPCRQ